MLNLRRYFNPNFLVSAAVVCAGLGVLAVQQLKLENAKSLNGQLDAVLTDTLKEKEQLLDRIQEAETQLQEKDERIRQLGEAAVLKNSLDNAQKVIEQLNNELASVNAERISLQNANLGLTAKIQGLTKELTRNFDELKAAREAAPQTALLKKKMDDLTRDLGLRQQELAGVGEELKRLQQLNKDLARKNVELEKKAAMSPAAVGERQAAKLADQLKKREAELEAAKKEAADAREKLAALQANVVSLQQKGREDADNPKARELEGRAQALEKRVAQLQESLQQKTELADSLQKNLLYLTQQLARKDDEMRQLQAKNVSSDSRAREELARQQQRYDEMNALYAGLKRQLDRKADELNLKDAELALKKKESAQAQDELALKRKEAAQAQEELATLRSRLASLQSDLGSASRQRNAWDEAADDQQQKADDLRRRVEIMLEPQGKRGP